MPRSIAKDEAKLEDFYYACAGYSIYLDQSGKESSGDKQTQGKLPVCVGLEVISLSLFYLTTTRAAKCFHMIYGIGAGY